MARLKNGSIIRVSRGASPAPSSLGARMAVRDRETDRVTCEAERDRETGRGTPDAEEAAEFDDKDLASRLDLAILLKEDGNALYKQGNFLGAAQRYTEALEVICFTMGSCYWLKLQPDVVTLSSNRSAAYLQLALLARDQADKADLAWRARLDASWCVTTNGAWAKGWLRLGTVFLALGDQQEAMNIFLQGLQDCPGDRGLSRQVSDCLSPSLGRMTGPGRQGEPLLVPLGAPTRQDGALKACEEEAMKGTARGKGVSDVAWLRALQGDQGRLRRMGMQGRGLPLPSLAPGGDRPQEVVLGRVKRVTKANWASMLPEAQGHDWLGDCFRLRETKDGGGVSRERHLEPCHSLGLLPFIVFCRLLQRQEKQLLPRHWDWGKFIKRISKQCLNHNPVVLQVMEHRLNVLRLNRVDAFRGADDHDMVDFAAGVYGCGLDEPWPATTLHVRKQVTAQWQRWLRTKSPEVFQAVGGPQVWTGLLTWRDDVCDCKARLRGNRK